MTIQLKAIEQYFHVVLFVLLRKVVPKSAALTCDTRISMIIKEAYALVGTAGYKQRNIKTLRSS